MFPPTYTDNYHAIMSILKVVATDQDVPLLRHLMRTIMLPQEMPCKYLHDAIIYYFMLVYY